MVGEQPTLNKCFKTMEKVEELDLKTGEPVSTGDGQPEKTEEQVAEPGVAQEVQEPEKAEPQEDVEALKARLAKAEEERENLSKAVTRLNKERKLPQEEEVKEEEGVYPEWDETSKKFQEQTLTQAEKKAQATAQAILEKSNEKAAIEKFTTDNPDVDWEEVIKNYNPSHGKDTVNGIVRDLNRALVLTRYDKGELTTSEAKAAKAKLAEGSTVSKTTSKTTKGAPNISPGALSLAEKMRVNPEKLAQEDDSLTATINI